MQRRPLHLAVVGGGSNAQSMVLGDGGQREQKHVVVDEDDDDTIQCRPRTPQGAGGHYEGACADREATLGQRV